MRWIALLVPVFALSAAGCMTVPPLATPAATQAGYSYTGGRASQVFRASPSLLQSSILSAMDDLRIGSVRQTHDAGAIQFEGTTADSRRAIVTLRPDRESTRVSVRIGWFGDEPLSKALMDRVGIRLGVLPPAAIPVDPPSSPGKNPYFSRDAVSDEMMFRDQPDIYRDSPVPN